MLFLAGKSALIFSFVQVLTDCIYAIKREEVKLQQELQRLSAWRDRVAYMVTAFAEFAGYYEKHPASMFACLPPTPPVPELPELKLIYLSHEFHEVC